MHAGGIGPSQTQGFFTLDKQTGLQWVSKDQMNWLSRHSKFFRSLPIGKKYFENTDDGYRALLRTMDTGLKTDQHARIHDLIQQHAPVLWRARQKFSQEEPSLKDASSEIEEAMVLDIPAEWAKVPSAEDGGKNIFQDAVQQALQLPAPEDKVRALDYCYRKACKQEKGQEFATVLYQSKDFWDVFVPEMKGPDSPAKREVQFLLTEQKDFDGTMAEGLEKWLSSATPDVSDLPSLRAAFSSCCPPGSLPQTKQFLENKIWEMISQRAQNIVDDTSCPFLTKVDLVKDLLKKANQVLTENMIPARDAMMNKDFPTILEKFFIAAKASSSRQCKDLADSFCRNLPSDAPIRNAFTWILETWQPPTPVDTSTTPPAQPPQPPQ